MAVQAQSYRAEGAIGLGWYAWSLSAYPTARTPDNDPDLAAGVERARVGWTTR
jgi:hypothetical protein